MSDTATDESVNLISIANQNIARASEVRNNIINELTRDGKLPSDNATLSILLSTVDGMDRTAIQTKRLSGDAEERDINRQALEIAKKLEGHPSMAREVRDFDREMVDETIIEGSVVQAPSVTVDLGVFEFNEGELSASKGGSDWESMRSEQESIQKAVDDLNKK